jgi:deoxyribodipyrimidine photo-lyase
VPLPAPGGLPGPARSIREAPIPGLSDLELPAPSADTRAFPEPGETAARRRLARWLEAGIGDYAETRDQLDGDGTSRISQDLRFGLLSPIEIADQAGEAERGPGPGAWLAELCWRDFYLQLLAHHPRVLREPFRAAFRGFSWANDPAGLEAWRTGRTGYPVVDAAMRHLGRNGFMPNRARMIVASFLAKHLRIDWREGETHFMRHLVDGEPAANDGGWQWTASTGTDAQPWFRVFDPVSQGQRFDPHGTYVRRWVPELARVPDAYIHAPWTMPGDVQAELRCRIGIDYPAPIVDHREARAAWFAAVDAAGIRPSSR